MILFASDLFCKLVHFLEIQMKLLLGWFDSEAGIGGHSIVPNLAILHGFLKELEGFRETVEKYRVSVVRALTLVRVVQVVHVQALQVQTLKGFVQLVLQEFRVQ